MPDFSPKGTKISSLRVNSNHKRTGCIIYGVRSESQLCVARSHSPGVSQVAINYNLNAWVAVLHWRKWFFQSSIILPPTIKKRERLLKDKLISIYTERRTYDSIRGLFGTSLVMRIIYGIFRKKIWNKDAHNVLIREELNNAAKTSLKRTYTNVSLRFCFFFE